MSQSKCEIIYRRSPSLDSPTCNYNGFKPGKNILKKGTVCKAGHMPLKCDIIYEPLDNFDTVIKFLKLVNDPKGPKER